MKKNNLDFIAANELHRQGQLNEAEAGYLALLRKNPRAIDVLHSLGILYAQKENFADAIRYLRLAITYQPNDVVLQLHLANVLKSQGLLAEACDVLQKALDEKPDYTAALNNLGTVYYALGKLPEAIQAYQQVIQKDPHFIDAYYNLGLALGKQQKWSHAIDAYQTLLALTPDHFAARFHLACALMNQGNIDASIAEFLRIEPEQPNHFETQFNLATCYLKKGALKEAKLHYLNALELNPTDTQILFNLAVISTEQGDLDRAIQYYQKAIQQQPDFFAAHNNLGVAFIAKQHIAFALHHFQEAWRLQPENTSIRYTIQALSQNKHLLAAPTDYVKSLFNAYADHYEQHLLSALDYQLPMHIKRALENFHPLSAAWDILDLGCGTGLCGVLLKPFAKTLTGVDLSEKMLQIAQDKKIYNDLLCEDIHSFLTNTKTTYYVIVAADVLVYIGELTLLFQQVHAVLRERGLFIFNTEISEQEAYVMNQSGRFSHQKFYIEQLAKKNHFSVAHYEKIVTRLQNSQPVYGHLYVLQR